MSSPTPWRLTDFGYIEDANGRTVVLGLRDCDMNIGWDEAASEDDMELIVAAVNAYEEVNRPCKT